jgi:hypothetical protein
MPPHDSTTSSGRRSVCLNGTKIQPAPTPTQVPAPPVAPSPTAQRQLTPKTAKTRSKADPIDITDLRRNLTVPQPGMGGGGGINSLGF